MLSTYSQRTEYSSVLGFSCLSWYPPEVKYCLEVLTSRGQILLSPWGAVNRLLPSVRGPREYKSLNQRPSAWGHQPASNTSQESRNQCRCSGHKVTEGPSHSWTCSSMLSVWLSSILTAWEKKKEKGYYSKCFSSPQSQICARSWESKER